MATGVLSIGLHLTGYEVLSRVTLVMTGVAWVALAATTVLGARVSALGRHLLAEALLALAAVLWPVLLGTVVRRWKRDMPGTVFLCCVATQGLAVLGAVLAPAEASAWLAHTALVLFWLGLVLYGVALALFDPRQVAEGAGDQWVAGGALAVSALAGAKRLVRRPARRRGAVAAAALRPAAVGDGVPDGDDGGGDTVRRHRRRRPLAEGARAGAAVGRGGGMVGRRRGGPGRGPGVRQVQSTAMKTFATVSSPTRPNRGFSTVSSSRFT